MLLVLDTTMVQGQDLAAGGAPQPAERLQRLDPRGFRPARTSRWRITVNRESHIVTVYRDGRKQRAFPAVIGAPATPTPRGLYAIYEKLPQPNPKGFLGPWALHLTAFSNVLLNYGGGPGPRRDPRTRRHEPGRSARVVGARTAASASTTRTSSGWPGSSRSARPS